MDAVTIILDVGKSASKSPLGGGSSFFQKAKDCISWIIRRKILSLSRDLVSLILTGTDESGENLGDVSTDLYTNACMKYDFQVPSWDMLKFIDDKVKTTCEDSDWVGALAVALEKFNSLNIDGVTSKSVVIFSDLSTTLTANIEYIGSIIRNSNIDVTFVASDHVRKMYDKVKMNGEPSSKRCHLDEELTDVDSCEKAVYVMWNWFGDFIGMCNFESAVRQLSCYKAKTVSPTSWDCVMDVCNLKINIQLFKRVDEIPPIRPSLKCLKQCEKNKTQTEDLALTEVVRDIVMYYKHVDPDTKECTDVSIEKEDVIDGFRYGTSVIPFSDVDKLEMGYKSGQKCFTVLTITEVDNIPHSFLAGDGSYIVVPRDGDEKAEVALSAFIQALSGEGLVAIVRRVVSNDRGLSVGVLYPVVEESGENESNHKEFLIFIELAFKDDLVKIGLPTLSRIKKTLKSDQFKLIDDLINEMDLMNVGVGDSTDTYEALDSSSRHEVYCQFFHHCIVHKALYPEKPLPTEHSTHLQKYILQSGPLFPLSNVSERLLRLFPIKGKTQKNSSAADDDKVSTRLAYPSHQSSSEDKRTPESILRKLFEDEEFPRPELIRNYLDKSVGEYGFDLRDVVKALIHFTRVVRQKTLKSFTDDYNIWMKKLRSHLGVNGKVQKSYWQGVCDGDLGLITEEEHKDSLTKKEDAKIFMNVIRSAEEDSDKEKQTEVDGGKETIDMLF